MLLEGKYDKNTFKAVFLAGLPGSGKTEFYNQALRGKDLKHLDSDKVMTFLVKKYGGDIGDTSNYSRFQNEVKRKLEIMNKMYKEGGLGMVIDGTGRDFNKIKQLKIDLEKYGYDTMMVFIKTPLKDALKRVETRDRGVDKDYLKKVYKDLNNNILQYKKIFTSFIEVNSEDEYPSAEKKVDKWLNS